MSLVFIHIGQCGNQLGQAFWKEMETLSQTPTRTLKNKKISSYSHVGLPADIAAAQLITPHVPYSLPDGSLPCILVDSEPKVVQGCAQILGDTKISKEFVLSDKTGRGNNWAYGYNGRNLKNPQDLYGPGNLAECVMEGVRRTAERCDRFTGTVLFHSLSGGTGSGLGSALVERLRDEYPLAYLLSVLVAPFEQGETPLQHYNSLLCLSWVQRYCDTILLLRNDSVLEQIKRQASGQAMTRGGHQSLAEMNANISKCLGSVFLPLWSPNASMGCFEPLDMMRSLCPDPSTKFITPHHTDSSRSTTTWEQLITSCTHPTPPTHTHTSSLIFIARGNNSNMDTLMKNTKSVGNKLKRIYNTVAWNPFPVDFWFSKEPHFQEKKCVSILANTSQAGDYMRSVHEKAKMMFDEKAYLHWYQKYNCEETVFREAFENVKTIIDNYYRM